MPGQSREERAAIFDSHERRAGRLHKVDPAASGSPTMAAAASTSPARWRAGASSTPSSRRRHPAMDKLSAWLPEHIPAGRSHHIVHGDYRLGNLIVHPTEPRVVASTGSCRPSAIPVRPSPTTAWATICRSARMASPRPISPGSACRPNRNTSRPIAGAPARSQLRTGNTTSLLAVPLPPSPGRLPPGPAGQFVLQSRIDQDEPLGARARPSWRGVWWVGSNRVIPKRGEGALRMTALLEETQMTRNITRRSTLRSPAPRGGALAAVRAQQSILPDRPLKILVGFPAAAAPTSWRAFWPSRSSSARPQRADRQQIGASGTIAVEALKNAAPDGTTIAYVAVGQHRAEAHHGVGAVRPVDRHPAHYPRRHGCRRLLRVADDRCETRCPNNRMAEEEPDAAELRYDRDGLVPTSSASWPAASSAFRSSRCPTMGAAAAGRRPAGRPYRGGAAAASPTSWSIIARQAEGVLHLGHQAHDLGARDPHRHPARLSQAADPGLVRLLRPRQDARSAGQCLGAPS